MSIQWTFIATYLYVEIAIVLILISPIITPRKWYHFFRSRLFSMLFGEQTAMYFYGLLGILSLFLVDSVREMRKYSQNDSGHGQLASEMKGSVKLFRAQRNFYITGFAIFLAFVIRRLVTMIIVQYELQLETELIIRQVEDTVNLAKTTVIKNESQNNVHDFEEIKNKLKDTEHSVEVLKIIIKELEKEATGWRLKFETQNSVEHIGDN